jgi:hypothetical protein
MVMTTKPPVNKGIQVTVGDLVVTAIDTALEVAGNERKAYRLARIVLNKMLNDSRLQGHRFRCDLSGRNLRH